MSSAVVATKRKLADMDCCGGGRTDGNFNVRQHFPKKQRCFPIPPLLKETEKMQEIDKEGILEVVKGLFMELREISRKIDRIETKLDYQTKAGNRSGCMPYHV